LEFFWPVYKASNQIQVQVGFGLTLLDSGLKSRPVFSS